MIVILALDSFKESFSSVEINGIVANELINLNPLIRSIVCPVSDGGEGSLEVLQYHGIGERKFVSTMDPLFRPIDTYYLLSPDTKTAYIEMARASGIELLKPDERNCFHTSSYGTGILIDHALKNDAKQIYLFVGGSATNDCGTGMAQALGCIFYKESGQVDRITGGDMNSIVKIEYFPKGSPLEHTRSTVLCDVDNPLSGKFGATFTYGRQKGANEEELILLEEGVVHISRLVEQYLQKNLSQLPGSGAAGGMGFGAMAFLDARIERGAPFILDSISFDQTIQSADLIITGEGKLDHQTLHGKLISEILKRAMDQDKSVIAISALAELSELDFRNSHLSKIFTLYRNKPQQISKQDSISRIKSVCSQIIKEFS